MRKTQLAATIASVIEKYLHASKYMRGFREDPRAEKHTRRHLSQYECDNVRCLCRRMHLVKLQILLIYGIVAIIANRTRGFSRSLSGKYSQTLGEVMDLGHNNYFPRPK